MPEVPGSLLFGSSQDWVQALKGVSHSLFKLLEVLIALPDR